MSTNQTERVRDGLRKFNYDIPEQWDNDDIARFVEVILDSLGLELPEHEDEKDKQ